MAKKTRKVKLPKISEVLPQSKTLPSKKELITKVLSQQPKQRKKIWFKHPKESNWQYRVFIEFRSIGAKRTIPMLSDMEIEGKAKISAGILYKWGRWFDWTKRCGAWDQAIDKAGITEHMQAVRRMNKRHATAAMQAHKVLLTLYAEFTRRMKTEPDAFEKMKTREFMALLNTTTAMMDKITKVERTAQGEAGEVFQAHVGITAQTSAERNDEMFVIIRSDSEALALWSELQARLDHLKRIASGEESDVIDIEAEDG